MHWSSTRCDRPDRYPTQAVPRVEPHRPGERADAEINACDPGGRRQVLASISRLRGPHGTTTVLHMRWSAAQQWTWAATVP
jgi:hypothetical protein